MSVTEQATVELDLDTGGWTAGLSKATSGVKKFGETTTATVKGFSEEWNRAAKAIAPFRDAVGQVQQAVQTLRTGLEYARLDTHMKALEKAIPSGALDRFSNVVGGTVNKMELAAAASKALSGDFKLTQDQFISLERAAIALNQRGFGPTGKILGELVTKVQKGGKQLDDFQIQAGSTEEALRKLGEIGRGVKLDETAASIHRAEAALDDLALGAKRAVGSLVSDVLTGLDSLKKGGAGNWFTDFAGLAGASNLVSQRVTEVRKHSATFRAMEASDSPEANAEYSAVKQAIRDRENRTPFDLAGSGFFRNVARNAKNLPRGGGGGGSAPSWDDTAQPWAELNTFGNHFANAVQRFQGAVEIAASARATQGQVGGAAGSALMTFGTGLADAKASGLGGGGMGGLLKFGGALREQKQSADEWKSAMDSAFGGAANGLMASAHAAITASEIFGKASKSAGAEMLKSIGIQALGKAAWEGAEALGSLALGPLGGVSAAAHAKAAAAYLGVAAVVGGLGASLGAAAGPAGGRGGAVPSGGAGGGFLSGGSAPNDNGPRNITVNIINPITANGASELGVMVTKGIDAAKKSGGVRDERTITLRHR
jgi:hypothetical protein